MDVGFCDYGLLIHRRCNANIVDVLRHSSGRLTGAVLRGGTDTRPSHTLVACAYMPSGLDHSGERIDLAETLYHDLRRWLALPHVDIAIILGDFNETDDAGDRRTVRAADNDPAVGGIDRPDSLLAAFVRGDSGDGPSRSFTDAYRRLHTSDGFTHVQFNRLTASFSRLDRVLYCDNRSDDLLRSLGYDDSSRIDTAVASVQWPSPIAAGSSGHAPVLIGFRGDFGFHAQDANGVDVSDDDTVEHKSGDTARFRPPDIKRANDAQRARASAIMERLVGAREGKRAVTLLQRAQAAANATCTVGDLDDLTVAIVNAAIVATAAVPRYGALGNRHRAAGNHWHVAAIRLMRRLACLRNVLDNSIRANDPIGYDTTRLYRHVATIRNCWKF